MFRLRTGYLITGIVIGSMLIVSFLWSLPDGKLHMIFCDVGQGDAAYIRFPDGRDMVVDGGPNNKVIECLGRHMPFWDRTIDIVLGTHPQKDHIGGLPEVLRRFTVGFVVRPDVQAPSDIYREFIATIREKHVEVKYPVRGDAITIGPTKLTLLWPSKDQIAKGKEAIVATRAIQAKQGTQEGQTQNNVLGASVGDLNDYSIVFWLRYGTFDAIFTGDADTRVEENYRGSALATDGIEVLKVNHHGSKTGMSEAYLQWLKPRLAVISVGKNSYGHPSEEILAKLAKQGARVLRTDQEGDIEVVSDGRGWQVL